MAATIRSPNTTVTRQHTDSNTRGDNPVVPDGVYVWKSESYTGQRLYLQKRDADRGAHEKARERAVHAAGAAPASALRRGLVSEVRGPPRRRSVGRALLGRPN